MSMMWDAARAQAMEGADPDDQEFESLTELVRHEYDNPIEDILRGMLIERGMTAQEVATELEAACRRWLEKYADEEDRFQSQQQDSRNQYLAEPCQCVECVTERNRII